MTTELHAEILAYDLAYAAAKDAANRRMRDAGRTIWDAEDYAAAVAEFKRLLPGPAKEPQP